HGPTPSSRSSEPYGLRDIRPRRSGAGWACREIASSAKPIGSTYLPVSLRSNAKAHRKNLYHRRGPSPASERPMIGDSPQRRTLLSSAIPMRRHAGWLAFWWIGTRHRFTRGEAKSGNGVRWRRDILSCTRPWFAPLRRPSLSRRLRHQHRRSFCVSRGDSARGSTVSGRRIGSARRRRLPGRKGVSGVAYIGGESTRGVARSRRERPPFPRLGSAILDLQFLLVWAA